MQWYAVPMVALLMATGLSGCIVSLDWGNEIPSPNEPVTAGNTSGMRWVERDVPHRENWELMAVYGVMGTPNGIDYPIPNTLIRFSPEPNVPSSAPPLEPHQIKQGKLHVWAHLDYLDNGAFIFSQHTGRGGGGSGTDLAHMPAVLHDIAGHVPLDLSGDWIDSDEAMAVALDKHAEARTLLNADQTDVLMLLHHVEHHDAPHWSIMFDPHEDQAPLLVTIDAFTGALLDPHQLYPGKESIGGQAEVELSIGEQVHPFTVETRHALLSAAVLPAGDTLPLSDVDATLYLPERPFPATSHWELEGQWPDTLLAHHLAPHPGDYTINAQAHKDLNAVRLPVGHETVQVHWCLDGALPDPFGLHPRGECLTDGST